MLGDERGGVLLEVTVSIMVLLLVLFGVIDFSRLFYQWNAASKATELGARLAVVSNPVSSDIDTLAQTMLTATILPGDLMPYFKRECRASTANGSSGSCIKEGGAAVSGAYRAASLQTIFFGRGNNGTCNISGANAGMCKLYPGLTADKVIIIYEQTGLGYAGRPDGRPVPTVTVKLTGLQFQYSFLGDLLGFSAITMGEFATTVTGEDLNPVGS